MSQISFASQSNQHLFVRQTSKIETIAAKDARTESPLSPPNVLKTYQKITRLDGVLLQRGTTRVVEDMRFQDIKQGAAFKVTKTLFERTGTAGIIPEEAFFGSIQQLESSLKAELHPTPITGGSGNQTKAHTLDNAPVRLFFDVSRGEDGSILRIQHKLHVLAVDVGLRTLGSVPPKAYSVKAGVITASPSATDLSDAPTFTFGAYPIKLKQLDTSNKAGFDEKGHFTDYQHGFNTHQAARHNELEAKGIDVGQLIIHTPLLTKPLSTQNDQIGEKRAESRNEQRLTKRLAAQQEMQSRRRLDAINENTKPSEQAQLAAEARGIKTVWTKKMEAKDIQHRDTLSFEDITNQKKIDAGF